MASFSRRRISSFNLSFLDIMFCGFGAVVLLVLIINTHTLTRRSDRVADIEAELQQAAMEQRLTAVHLERQQADISRLEGSISALQRTRTAFLEELEAVENKIGEGQRQSAEEQIAALQNELQQLEKELQAVTQQKAAQRQAGRQVRAFVGSGNRQYLTGLRLDGQRVLILVDSSASMLDSRIVDVVRRKVLDENSRRAAPKWQKAISTVEWLVANLPQTSSIQIHHFNTSVVPLTGNDGEGWTSVTRFEEIDSIISTLKELAPLGGTNLEAPFLKARSLTPQPDNIVLITDGLPTQGKGGARSSTIDGKGRVKLFQKAVKNLPAKVPVNTILFSMEGDPLASSLLWQLAVDSGGSFFTPTRDWP
ncbi:MAG: VWA domain-containing protein [Desulfocapsaceae bacterium]